MAGFSRRLQQPAQCTAESQQHHWQAGHGVQKGCQAWQQCLVPGLGHRNLCSFQALKPVAHPTRRMTRKRAAANLSLFCAHTLKSSSLSASKEDLKVLDQTQFQRLGKESCLVRLANQAKGQAGVFAFLASGSHAQESGSQAQGFRRAQKLAVLFSNR
ncbi:TPA: hypothetical protein ACH3X1_007475 [Trebouxia sp. C0004]